MTITRSFCGLVLSAILTLFVMLASGAAPASPTAAPTPFGAPSPISGPSAPTVSPTVASATSPASTTAPAKSAGNLTGEIKIGALETLTGDNSSYGISIKNALDLGTSEINQSKFLGNATINLTVLDDKGDKQEGISVMNRLISQDKVVGVMGPTLSNTANGITDMGNFIFRDSLPEAGVIPGTIDAVKAKLNPKKAAIIYEVTNEFTKSAYDVFKSSLTKDGIQITDTETYNHGDSDFRTQLTKIKATNPDIVVVSALIGEAIPILQQAREVGITQPIVGGNGFNNPNIYKQGGQAAEGVILGSAWFIGSKNPKSQAFVAAYQKEYNTDPDQFSAQAFDGMYLMATAIKNAGSADPKAIRDALANIRNYDGVLGNFSFDAHRDPVNQPAVLQVKGGKFELLQ